MFYFIGNQSRKRYQGDRFFGSCEGPAVFQKIWKNPLFEQKITLLLKWSEGLFGSHSCGTDRNKVEHGCEGGNFEESKSPRNSTKNVFLAKVVPNVRSKKRFSAPQKS